MAHGQFSLLETLIASIFRPHNSYCIFVDGKASQDYHQMVRNLVHCYKDQFPQVHKFTTGARGHLSDLHLKEQYMHCMI